MPFTPFHLGPALAFGTPFSKRIHLPTFLIANVYIDLEPLIMVTILRLNYPLHGYLHTFLFAGLAGLGLGYLTYLLDGFLNPVWKTFKLIDANTQYGLKEHFIAGVSGSILHVAFDAPLYSDIMPFYPCMENPLYELLSNSQCFGSSVIFIYELTILLGVYGLALYLKNALGPLTLLVINSLIYLFLGCSLFLASLPSNGFLTLALSIVSYITTFFHIVAYVYKRKDKHNALRYLRMLLSILAIFLGGSLISIQLISTEADLCLKIINTTKATVFVAIVALLHLHALKTYISVHESSV